jgi:hypothetical protein
MELKSEVTLASLWAFCAEFSRTHTWACGPYRRVCNCAAGADAVWQELARLSGGGLPCLPKIIVAPDVDGLGLDGAVIDLLVGDDDLEDEPPLLEPGPVPKCKEEPLGLDGAEVELPSLTDNESSCSDADSDWVHSDSPSEFEEASDEEDEHFVVVAPEWEKDTDLPAVEPEPESKSARPPSNWKKKTTFNKGGKGRRAYGTGTLDGTLRKLRTKHVPLSASKAACNPSSIGETLSITCCAADHLGKLGRKDLEEVRKLWAGCGSKKAQLAWLIGHLRGCLANVEGKEEFHYRLPCSGAPLVCELAFRKAFGEGQHAFSWKMMQKARAALGFQNGARTSNSTLGSVDMSPPAPRRAVQLDRCIAWFHSFTSSLDRVGEDTDSKPIWHMSDMVTWDSLFREFVEDLQTENERGGECFCFSVSSHSILYRPVLKDQYPQQRIVAIGSTETLSQPSPPPSWELRSMHQVPPTVA